MICRRTHGRIVWMTGVALLCAAPMFAQQSPGAQPNPQPGTSGGTGAQSPMGAPDSMGAQSATGASAQSKAGDKHFVKEATESSNAEIALGKLAQQNSSSQDVKQFGERMVTDHTKLNDQMAPVAQQLGVTVGPDQIPAKDKALQTKLQGLTGDQFDKAYIRAMVKDHKEDLKKFRREASSARDPMLRQNAQQGAQ